MINLNINLKKKKNSGTNSPSSSSPSAQFCEFLVNMVISVLFALLPHLLVEVPFGRLYRVYLSKSFHCATIELKRRFRKAKPVSRMDAVQFGSVKNFT